MGKREMTLLALSDDLGIKRITSWLTCKGKTRVQVLVLDNRIPGGLRPQTVTLTGPGNTMGEENARGAGS